MNLYDQYLSLLQMFFHRESTRSIQDEIFANRAKHEDETKRAA